MKARALLQFSGGCLMHALKVNALERLRPTIHRVRDLLAEERLCFRLFTCRFATANVLQKRQESANIRAAAGTSGESRLIGLTTHSNIE